MRPLATAALALSTAPFAAAADLWVGPAGSGLPFTDLQAAVDAAQPFDRIYVLAGEYGPVTIGKPLQLSGEGSDLTRIVGLADGTGAGRPALTIANVPPTGRVWVNGFEFAVDDAATTPADRLVELRDVPGSIELVDLKVYRDTLDATAPGATGAYLHVENCARVLGSDVRVITAAVPEVATEALVPFSALRATNSYVSFSEARFDAARTPAAAPGVELAGADAIVLEDSSLWLGLAAIEGGDRGDQGANPAVLAGDGIDAVNSQVRIHGGRNNGVIGGHAPFLSGPGVVAAGAAVRLDATSTLVQAADALLSGGDGLDNAVGPAVVAAPGALVDARADRLPTMWVQSPVGKLGTLHGVILEGDPNAIHLWWLALGTAPALAIPQIDGLWFMDPWIIHHPAVPMDTDGFGADVAPIGNAFGLLGLALCYQSLEIDGTNLQLALPWFASIEIY